MADRSTLEQKLTQLWYRSPAPPSLLQPLGWLYQAVVALRRWAYQGGSFQQHSVGKPVIVVGNLTVGGTGKTPLVAWLAQELSASGLKVGIVSRGYGRSSQQVLGVHAESDWREVGDEPLLLWQLTGCDTVVSRDRVAGARELVKRGVDIVIADDGLQHLRLARDCEVIVVDGARGFGNERLLPAGPLREPVTRLRHDSIVVVNGAAEHSSLGALRPNALEMRLHGGAARRLDGLEGLQPLEHFAERRVHAVAGIGNPQRFFRDLRNAGLNVVEHPFPDHHPFSAVDLTFGDDAPVLMTEKDAVKCRHLMNARLWYVPVTARFSDAQRSELLERVVQALAPVKA